MKITEIKIERFSAPVVEPLKIAFATMTDTDSWIVKVMTDEGIWGIGSASPFAPVTGETLESCYAVLKLFSEALIGFDALDIPGAHALMDQLIYANGSAKCAIDLALYDIAGKKQGLPVWRLLGGTNPVIENDITVGINDPYKMQASAKRYVFEKGFKIIKVKTGIYREDDLLALKLIREAVGDDVRIRIDANQSSTLEGALELLPQYEALGIDAAEQFLPGWDFEGAAELRRRNTTSVRLMMDESIHNHHDMERAVRLGCADYYNIKLMKCGGLYGGMKIADVAQKAGVGCMVGCMFENKISLAAGVALCAAKESIVEADCDTFMLFAGEDDGIAGGFDRDGGTFTLLETPGLGIEMDF